MKKTTLLLVLLLLMTAAAIGLNIVIITHNQEMVAEQKVINAVQDARIAELEKEIRILKTDIRIIQYGFEDER